jgi:hypothetical protein
VCSDGAAVEKITLEGSPAASIRGLPGGGRHTTGTERETPVAKERITTVKKMDFDYDGKKRSIRPLTDGGDWVRGREDGGRGDYKTFEKGKMKKVEIEKD